MPSLSKAYFLALFCEAILHGMYTILFGAAIWLLFKQRKTENKSAANLAMIILTILMYCMSTVHIALALQVTLVAFFDQHVTEGNPSIFDNQGDPLIWVQIGMELLNCVIGDAIVCWRTWILYNRDWRVLVFPALCITGGFVSGVGMTHALSRSPDGEVLFGEDVTVWFVGFGVLTCVANLYSVGAIAYKAWQHNRMTRAMNVGAHVGGRNISVLLVIVESGGVYCLALIITVLLFMLDNNGVYVISDMLAHLTGIYPTIIIVLVCLKITFHDDIARAHAPRTVRVPTDTFSSQIHSRISQHQSAPQKGSTEHPLLNWRPGRKQDESDTGVQVPSTFAMRPIKIATKTEQETWYDPEDKSRSASIAGMDRDEVLEISPRKMGHGNGEAV